MNSESVINQIDEIHRLSKDALTQKKIDLYLAVFSENVRYKQFDGKIIDKKELRRNTETYLHRLKTVKSEYERKKYSLEGSRFTEHLIQKATASINIFIFFTKKWTIE